MTCSLNTCKVRSGPGVSGVREADDEILKPNPPPAENLKPSVSKNMLSDKTR